MRCGSDVSGAFAYFHFLKRPVLQTQPSGLIRIVGAPRTAIFHARQATKWAHRDDKIENLDMNARYSLNGHYGIFESGLPCQSALMPTNFTMPHFSVSSAISVPKSASNVRANQFPRSVSCAEPNR